jgi:hypothetical protein
MWEPRSSHGTRVGSHASYRACRVVWILVVGAALGPTAASAGSPRRSLADALSVTALPSELAANPQLLARLRETPYGYFRFVNVPFSQEVCERFKDVASELPAVNLHGDAHVEQYAVTSLGRGLTDFDDSSTGPFVIDLVRFGVSLRLAASAHRWGRYDGAILEALFRGYRSALLDPAFVPPEPSILGRLRANFTGDHARRLEEADALMTSTGGEMSGRVQEAAHEYVEGLLAAHPELPRTFFAIKRVGVLRMGIGSALDRKLLTRVEGPTDSDDDDVLLEAKEVKDVSMIGCVNAPPGAGRILAGQSRIANQPVLFAGFLRFDGATFWVHAWPDDYAEVTVDALKSLEDLESLALDAGAQLGRGAPRSLPGVAEGPLREALVKALARHEGRIRREIAAFADATVDAWARFRRKPLP